LNNKQNIIFGFNKNKENKNDQINSLRESENRKNSIKLILKKKKISLKNNFEESAIALNDIKVSKNELSPNDKISIYINSNLNSDLKKDIIYSNESLKEKYRERIYKTHNSFNLEDNDDKINNNIPNNELIDFNQKKVIIKKEE